MKPLRIILLAWIILFSISCNQKPSASIQNKETQIGKIKDTLPRYTSEMVVNKKDFICGMPVKAGIEDTAHVNGKAYGFCSKECKDAFLKNPTAYISANK
jgi:YHS domain-containing protein